MNNEFKKITQDNVTRYVLESDGGTTSSGSIASNDSAGFKKGSLLTREGNKKTEPPKTRNPVAKNASAAIGGGAAGAHKDKKKAAKQGQEKHKKPYMENFNGEYDDEAGMAKGSLETMSRAVNGLMDTIQDGDNLPEWAQEKLSIAEDYLTTVWDYLLSQKEQGIDPGIGEGKEDKIEQLKQDYATAVHWSKNEKSPQKREAARRKAETIKAHLEKQYKQGVAEGSGDSQITPGMKTDYGTVVKVNGNTVTVKASNGELTTMNIHDIQQGVAEGWDDIKKFGKKAAVAGAIGLGIGAANAGGFPSDVPAGGHNQLPDIVAHVKFKVGDKEVSKEINLGSHYRSPGEAGKELENFLKSKGIKFYEYSLERVKPTNNNLDSSPAVGTGNEKPSIDTNEPSSNGKNTGDYMAKEGAKVDRQAKHITASMMKKGKSKKDAESIAWAHIKHPKNESADSYFESLSNSLAEKLDPNAPVDDWVQDFAQANPEKYHQFRQNNRPGTRKSEKKIERMAQAASYAAKTGK